MLALPLPSFQSSLKLPTLPPRPGFSTHFSLEEPSFLPSPVRLSPAGLRGTALTRAVPPFSSATDRPNPLSSHSCSFSFPHWGQNAPDAQEIDCFPSNVVTFFQTTKTFPFLIASNLRTNTSHSFVSYAWKLEYLLSPSVKQLIQLNCEISTHEA